MPRIVQEEYYDGAMERINRLAMQPLLEELRRVLGSFELLVKEERDANGGAAVRKLIDQGFAAMSNWTKAQTGDVDWRKCVVSGAAKVCIGVEVQVSARSDLLVMDLIHLRKAVIAGELDLAVLVVPSDRLSGFLTDRAPSYSDALRHVAEARADDLPLLVLAIEHDGPGPALAKQRKRR